MDAFRRVLAEPGSSAAREALLAEWKRTGDKRAALLEQQLAYEEARRAGTHTEAQQRALNLLLATQGKSLAGELAGLVKKFVFRRGLVNDITIGARDFVAHARKLFALAPIQHVTLEAPLPAELDALFSVPELAKVGSLEMIGLGGAFGDAGALALARCTNLAQLRWLSLARDGIGQAGVEALAEAPALAGLAYLGLEGNPVDPTPYVQEVSEGLVRGGRPPLAEQLERRFGARPWLAIPNNAEDWPPERDRLVTTPLPDDVQAREALAGAARSTPPDDASQRHEAELEEQKFKRSMNIKPSKLVK